MTSGNKWGTRPLRSEVVSGRLLYLVEYNLNGVEYSRQYERQEEAERADNYLVRAMSRGWRAGSDNWPIDPNEVELPAATVGSSQPRLGGLPTRRPAIAGAPRNAGPTEKHAEQPIGEARFSALDRGTRLGDRELLRWISRQGFVTASHLMAKLSITQQAVSSRVRALSARGLLTSQHCMVKNYFVTTAGQRYAGIDLPVVREVRLATYEHSVLVTWVAIHYARSLVITEREIQATGTQRHWTPELCAAGELVGRSPGSGDMFVATQNDVWGTAGRGARKTHRPDLVLARAPLVLPSGHLGPGSIAFEIERTAKHKKDLDEILKMYDSSQEFAQVHYLPRTPGVENQLRTAVQRLRLNRLVTVHPAGTLDQFVPHR